MKTSRWKRYDEKSGLWISSRKLIYVFWFKFLIHAENDPKRVVDWSLYEDWGGRNVICDPDTKFDAWWKTNWKTLFGYKMGEEDKILYPLSKRPSGETIRPKAHGIRYALRVYELKYKYLLDGNDLTDEENESDGKKEDAWEIAKAFADEFPKRRKEATKDPSYKPEEWTMWATPDDDWVFHTARQEIRKKLSKENPTKFRKQKRNLQSRVGRYMKAAKQHLDSVCEGQFP
jgi:hypothetical protein